MTSTAATSTNRPEIDDSVEARILDAALIQFEKVGVKKTTIEDIARQADVDRVTVYRRIGSRDDVVRAVMTREVELVLAELDAISARNNDVHALVADIFVTVITRWRTHPLANRMLSLEPERVLPQLTTDGGPVFTMSVAATVAALRSAVRNGLLPDFADLDTRAEIVCRIVHSFILQPHGTVTLESEDALAAFARTYLVPIITG
ncbi:TetR/AcrR family transcriptional regulator [Nocardia sp. NPDC057440]|uniref:TetR/AcrR family transcriptional regulator n=1 Tax=Nocardia sp. NPDC057440 TaxID=3346134 RepID=UPI00366C6964